MFGDNPVENGKWKVEKLGNLVTVTSSKRIYAEEQSTEGIPFLRISDLVSKINGIDSNDLYIPEEKYHEFVENGLVPNVDDILVTSRGTLGLCYTITADDKFYFQDGMITWLKFSNHESILSIFLSFLFNVILKQKIDLKTNGATVKYVSISELKNLEIPVPPLELQNDFAAFVQQIDKSKFEMAIYEKLWYNYQIWRKKMGLFRGILDLYSTCAISDKFGLGAGFLYADYAWEKANERELNKMKAGVTQTITNYINENRKLLNDDLIQILNTFINSIANCNKFNANSILSELKNFLMHKCAYHSCIIEILNHSIEAIESIPEDNLDDGVKIQALQKTKNVIDCSDSNQLPILLKDLFSFYDENGIEVENKEELFDKFESLRKEYLV